MLPLFCRRRSAGQIDLQTPAYFCQKGTAATLPIQRRNLALPKYPPKYPQSSAASMARMDGDYNVF